MRENLAAAECVLADDAIKELDSMGVSGPPDRVRKSLATRLPVNVIPRGARADNRAPEFDRLLLHESDLPERINDVRSWG